jgi:hypothetical protein
MALVPEKTVSDIVTDFLASAPTLEEIAVYRLSDEFQERAHLLLDKNREGSLLEAERAQMEEFRQLDHLMTLIKAKAKLRLNAQHINH